MKKISFFGGVRLRRTLNRLTVTARQSLALPFLLLNCAFLILPLPPNAFGGTNAAVTFNTNTFVVNPANLWPSNEPAIAAALTAAGFSGGGGGSTNVYYATNAGNAGYATNAGTAGYATNAGTAGYATNAGSAATATTATTANNVSGTCALPASQLTGTLQNGVLPAILPAVSGANLTSLNGSSISSGTVSASYLPTATSSALGVAKFGSGLNVSSGTVSTVNNGTVTSVTFTGDGTVLSSSPSAADTSSGTVSATLANAAQNSVLAGPASGGAGAPSYQTAPTFSGANLTSLNASALSSGTVPTGREGSGTASSSTFLRGDQTWATPGGGGTVTSVTFTGDGTVLSSTPSAADTSSGTVSATLANAAQNSVLAGPASGGAAPPTFQTAPTFSGANLTSLNASSLVGTAPLAVIPAGISNASFATNAGNAGYATNAGTATNLAGMINPANLPALSTNEWWVSQTGLDSNPGDNPLWPLLTITKALAAANSAGGYNVIHLQSGFFNVPANTIVTNNTALIGEGAGQTWLTITPVASTYYLIVGGSNILLKDFTIGTNTQNGVFYYPVQIFNCTNFTAEGVTFSGDSDAVFGTFTKPSSGAFRHCAVMTGYDGVSLDETVLLATNSTFVFEDCDFGGATDNSSGFAGTTQNRSLRLLGISALVRHCNFFMTNSSSTTTLMALFLGDGTAGGAAKATVDDNLYAVTNQNYPALQTGIFINATNAILNVIGAINAVNISNTAPGTVNYDAAQFSSVTAYNISANSGLSANSLNIIGSSSLDSGFIYTDGLGDMNFRGGNLNLGGGSLTGWVASTNLTGIVSSNNLPADLQPLTVDNGVGLTNLNGSSIASGTVPASYLPTATSSALGVAKFGSGLSVSSGNVTTVNNGTVTSVTFTGDGTVLSSTPSAADTSSGTVAATLANAAQNSVLAGPASGGAGAPTYQTAPTFSGANLTSLPASQLTGTVPNAALGNAIQANVGTSKGDLAVFNGTNWVRISKGSDGQLLGASNATATGLSYFPAGGGSGTVTSVTFTGDGTVLSSTPSSADTSSGTVAATLANAAQNSVLAGPASGGAGAPTYQTAPTFSGANLTSLNASSLASGTMPSGRESANTVLLNTAQTITGAKTFTNAVTVWTNASGSASTGTVIGTNGNLYQVGNTYVVSSLSSSLFAGAGWVRVQGRYAYMTCDGQVNNWTTSDDLCIIDIQNPAAPSLITNFTSPQIKGAEGLEVAGRYAYVCGMESNCFVVIDISNPTAPVQVGYVSNAVSLLENEGVAVSGQYAYVIGEATGSGGYLTVVDISRPTSPTIVGSLADSTDLGEAATVQIKGHYAYVTGVDADRLAVVDISNPANPVLAGHSAAISGSGSVYIESRYAYVLDGTALDIVSVSNLLSSSMPIVGSVTIPGASSLYTIKVAGRFAFITDINVDAVYTVDVSNPTAPFCVGTNIDTVNLAYVDDITICGNYAYVTCNESTGRLTILGLPGILSPSASIGNLYGDDINVGNRAHVGGDLYVGNGIHSGPNGIYSQGKSGAGSGFASYATNYLAGFTSTAWTNTNGFNVVVDFPNGVTNLVVSNGIPALLFGPASATSLYSRHLGVNYIVTNASATMAISAE